MGLGGINYVIYPTPDLNDLKYVEGKLSSVSYRMVGRSRHKFFRVSVEGGEYQFTTSARKEKIAIYKNNIGKPISVWWRWNIWYKSPLKVVLNGSVVQEYSKANELKSSLLITYPLLACFILQFIYTLIRPWIRSDT